MLFLRPPTSNHGPGVIHCSFVLEPLPVTRPRLRVPWLPPTLRTCTVFSVNTLATLIISGFAGDPPGITNKASDKPTSRYLYVLDEAIISESPKQPHALTLGAPIVGKI